MGTLLAAEYIMAEVAPPAPPPVEEGDKNPLPPPPPPPPMTTLLVTDAMMIGGEDLRKQPYAERLKAAQMLCLALQRDHLETPAPGLPAPSHILFQVKPVYALADLATAIETVQAGTVEHNSLVGLGRRGVGGCMQLGVFFLLLQKCHWSGSDGRLMACTCFLWLASTSSPRWGPGHWHVVVVMRHQRSTSHPLHQQGDWEEQQGEGGVEWTNAEGRRFVWGVVLPSPMLNLCLCPTPPLFTKDNSSRAALYAQLQQRPE